eukprot:gnl/Chilomastix_caulleri/621.p1 GENE.gnl/Chilomastix_caulleri/621~~gnl/Chilomastix_caulleri/621.p1  ORF type:complete len:112 (+),score=16.92 gnl/Chilomastix_caulleri/621:34-369(+)
MSLKFNFSTSSLRGMSTGCLSGITRNITKVIGKGVEKGVDLSVAVKSNNDISLLEALKESSVHIDGHCGGFGVCGTCMVILDEATYKVAGEPDDDENDVLKRTSEIHMVQD